MRVRLKNGQVIMAVFVLSAFLEGVVWEGIGWLSLLYMLLQFRLPTKTRRKRNFLLVIVLLAVFAYVLVQISVLRLNSAQIMRLYGITKTIIALPVLSLCLMDYSKCNDIVKDIMPIIILVNIVMFGYLITGNESLNIVHGSRNYIGAINVVLLPYVWMFYPKENKYIRIIFIWFVFLLLLFSGSRTTLAAGMITVALLVAWDKSSRRKIKYTALIMAIVVIMFLLGSSIGLTNNLSRGISVLTNIHDQSRIDLMTSTLDQFGEYSQIQKKIGNGNNLVLWRETPPHNCFLEILLCYGIYGLVFFMLSIVFIIFYCLKSKNINRRYLLLELLIPLIIGFVQPFVTTGYLFQVSFAISFIAIMCESWRRNPEYA